MGLASALTTALTGLTAAETQIDVVGNNLANSQTVGFKASNTVFATQFLQTLSLGSAPTDSSGGTNPRQTGLGVQVAEITPDFTQGTIEISANPADLAIQGDGFFIVDGPSNERLYTRNGIFKTNSENQLVTVNGDRLLGYGVDDLFNLNTQALVPLEVPLGSEIVASATENVFFEGTFTPSGDVADTAEVLESIVLGDSGFPRPDSTPITTAAADRPSAVSQTYTHVDGGGALEEGETYSYKYTYVDADGNEGPPSALTAETIPVGNGLDDNSINIGSIPPPPAGSPYTQIRIYRTDAGSTTDYKLIGTISAATSTFTDTGAAGGTVLDEDTLTGNYSYLVTYFINGQPESRPSSLVGPISVVDGRVRLENFPALPTPGAGDTFPAYTHYKLYRNTATDSSNFYEVATIAPGDTFIDNVPDTTIALPANLIDMDGPKAGPNTVLGNILTRDGLSFEAPFQNGELTFTGRKGGRTLGDKTLTVDGSTTLLNLMEFMEDSMGIQVAADDPTNPIPNSQNAFEVGGSDLPPGITIEPDGRIRVVSNNGVDNAADISLSAFSLLADADLQPYTPRLGFGSIQDAVGQSTSSDFLVYDSLGTPISVRVTAVLEDRTSTQTIYRWFADTADNQPLTGTEIAVGTGLVVFDGEGSLVSVGSDSVSVERRDMPAASPLEFDLDFSEISGLTTDEATLAATRQDGSPAGTLTSFRVGEDGIISGVFDNGVARTLGQVQLARFTNPAGLEQRGENLYRAGANSGLPVQNDPGAAGAGSLISGAVELSNTDIGENLIDLVLATTMYRGNTRVITTAQQLIDELLNLRR